MLHGFALGRVEGPFAGIQHAFALDDRQCLVLELAVQGASVLFLGLNVGHEAKESLGLTVLGDPHEAREKHERAGILAVFHGDGTDQPQLVRAPAEALQSK